MRPVRIAVLSLVLCNAALAQTHSIPRTSEGRPDFTGIWDATWLTPLERPDAIVSVRLSDADHENALKVLGNVTTARLNTQLGAIGEAGDATELARVDGSWRSAQVVDPPEGRIPFVAGLPPYVASDDGPEAFPPNARCIGGAARPPMSIAPVDVFRQIVQTTDHAVIYSGGLGELRIVRIGGAPGRVVSDLGDSIARWDGDTLVVETTNFDGRIVLRGPPVRNPMRAGAQALLVERFTLTGPNEVIYRYTLTDPEHYTRPWSAEYNMIRSTYRFLEPACHEGNYSMANMLSGARETERRAAAKR